MTSIKQLLDEGARVRIHINSFESFSRIVEEIEKYTHSFYSGFLLDDLEKEWYAVGPNYIYLAPENFHTSRVYHVSGSCLNRVPTMEDSELYLGTSPEPYYEIYY